MIAADTAPRAGVLGLIGVWFETAAAWLLGVIWIAPLLYAVPVQLLAYHTAVVKGTDVDQPNGTTDSILLAEG